MTEMRKLERMPIKKIGQLISIIGTLFVGIGFYAAGQGEPWMPYIVPQFIALGVYIQWLSVKWDPENLDLWVDGELFA